MKVRYDFVTNSSSSSFIISTKDVELDFLLNVVLKEFYVETRKQWNDETEEKIISWYNELNPLNNEDSSLGLFIKTKKEIDDYDDSYDWFAKDKQNNEEDNEKFYVVDNNCCVRFDWDIVEQVLKKYNIPWKYGYCD